MTVKSTSDVGMFVLLWEDPKQQSSPPRSFESFSSSQTTLAVTGDSGLKRRLSSSCSTGHELDVTLAASFSTLALAALERHLLCKPRAVSQLAECAPRQLRHRTTPGTAENAELAQRHVMWR